jgi:L-cysteine:1D-myo-inositol 2-amino-2-deoxy-alpha-D-glucopyranoside ligase
MDSWSTRKPPVLPLSADEPQLQLFDTASKRVIPVGPAPGKAGKASMYVCGITPYDAAHLGHAATYLAFDLVHRLWLDAGHTVHYVQNVTDVDCPLLARAEQNNEDWQDLATRETQVFRQDMAALSILPPRTYLGVVESMAGIVEMVEKLLASGAAYKLDDGTNDVYFDLATAPDFGYESGYDTETMLELFADNGGDPTRPGKRAQLDPLLWRGERLNEPSWPSPLGPGRPGWHIECSVIAANELGMGIDIQGGGADLIFPHHEMSAAHAEVAFTDHPFAKTYVHAGLIEFAGEKMSKSKGNLVFTSQLRADGVDPRAIRLALLAGHYRTHRPWSIDLLEHARKRLARWEGAVQLPTGPDARPLLSIVRARLANDLDTSGALAEIDNWAAATLIHQGTDTEAPTLVADLCEALLGVPLS